MTFAYRILKKLIDFKDQKLDKLPYRENLKDLKTLNESEFDNNSSQYTFSIHNSLWKSFIDL